jgi:hypothetical protein
MCDKDNLWLPPEWFGTKHVTISGDDLQRQRDEVELYELLRKLQPILERLLED